MVFTWSTGSKFSVGGIGMWDAATGEALRRFEVGNIEMTDVEIVRGLEGAVGDLTAVSTMTDNTVLVWDIKSARPSRRFNVPAETLYEVVSVDPVSRSAHVTALVELPGGSSIVPQRLVINLDTGEIVRRYQQDSLTSADFSADGRFIVSDTASGVQAVWDAVSEEQIRLLSGVGGFSVRAITPDSQNVLIGTDTGGLILWRVQSVNEMIEIVRARFDIVPPLDTTSTPQSPIIGNEQSVYMHNNVR